MTVTLVPNGNQDTTSSSRIIKWQPCLQKKQCTEHTCSYCVQPGQEPPSPQEEEANVWAHCQVMWGNLLYELSQMRAAVGEEWRPLLDEATGKFRAAGCPEGDIRQALSQHTMKEDIDLGPEPEPVQVRQQPPST